MELYPKNGDQMFAAYKKYSEELGEKFDDELIKESIARINITSPIKELEKFYPDNTVRLPSFVIPDDMTEDEALLKASVNGLSQWALHLLNMLSDYMSFGVIKDRGFSKYFLTMKAISDKATSMQLAGPSRGSCWWIACCLCAWCITQADPIKYSLLFSRFADQMQRTIQILIMMYLIQCL